MVAPHSDAARILGERVREVRRRRGLSQEDLADLAEMHVGNIGKIERGQSNPSLLTIVRIAGVLNTNPGTLVAGIGPESVPDRTHTLTARELIAERRARAG